MLLQNLAPYELKAFNLSTLKVESEALRNNPLSDSSSRLNPCLIPKAKGAFKCVLYLSGFTSNGVKNFNFRSFEKNFVEDLDLWTTSEKLEPYIYVFVDAWTSWGGSQFINSKGCGDYEDYILKDLMPSLKEHLPEEAQVTDFVVMGGSSGGYGALHLSSKHPETFQHCLAVAPDSDFELSLKPEVFKANYLLESYGGVKGFFDKLKKSELKTNRSSFHTIVNALAMGACYSDLDSDTMPILPLDKVGRLDAVLWEKWLSNDPIYFLPKRLDGLKKLKSIFLSVGVQDQFMLQYGARKINELLEKSNIQHFYEEFEGNHFDIGTRRFTALSTLK